MVAILAGGPVQQAIYDLLTADELLMGQLMITGVFDYVPEGQPRPYVTLGEATETPDNCHGGFGRETVVTLHVWTEARGTAQGQAIADRAVQLLDHQRLVVEGHHHVATRLEFGQALRDPDPRIRHHVLRFRVVTEQAS